MENNNLKKYRLVIRKRAGEVRYIVSFTNPETGKKIQTEAETLEGVVRVIYSYFPLED